MRAAAQYLTRHDMTADTTALVECLKRWCQIKLPEALADARQAIEAHMPEAAEITFRATMALAGIEAAREASRLPTNQ